MRLNLGAGGALLPDYENLDRKTGQECYPLPHADGSVDEVRASHLLEHFSHKDTNKVLREWVRVLKPSGLLKLAVPDFDWITRAYVNGEKARVQAYLMGGHHDSDDWHGAIFNRDTLFAQLEAAGLTDIEAWEPDADDCSAMPVSLNLQGRKADTRMPSLGWVMSVPRLGFMAAYKSWIEAIMLPLGVTPIFSDGAFWGQCLERGLTKFAERKDPPEWVLVNDYDTAVDWPTMRRLMLTAANHPEVDAIAATQMKRGEEVVPLMGLNGQERVDGKAFDPWMTKVDTAHFGLTLLRVSALQKLPHPWFWGQPGKGGRWDDDRVDDDIYFWKKWAEAGNSVYIANRCVIGHGDITWAWPDREFNLIQQTPNEFNRIGPPGNVRR